MAKDKDKTSKCALIGAPCPKTNDENAPIYCPDWVVNVPEVEKDGTGRVTAEVFYTGCQRRRQVLYLLSMTASAGQAAKSADEARVEVERITRKISALPIVVVEQQNPIADLMSGVNELLTEGNDVPLLGR